MKLKNPGEFVKEDKMIAKLCKINLNIFFLSIS